MRSNLFDSSILATAQQAVEFVSNILESSTEYSLIGKDLEGKILLWNEGARRMYGYSAEEVVGKLNSKVLHTPEDVATGKPREIMAAALRDGKWEGVRRHLRHSGRKRPCRSNITLDDTGGLTGGITLNGSCDEIFWIVGVRFNSQSLQCLAV
jgi:PAS domain S-box-containing protein